MPNYMSYFGGGGGGGMVEHANEWHNPDMALATDLAEHSARHEQGGADEISVAGLVGVLAQAQQVIIRKNSGANVGTRKRLNLVEGSNVTLTVADDAADDEIDVTIAAGGLANIQTGIYTGDGVDNRNINIGVDLASKTDVYVIIKGCVSVGTGHRIEYGQGDLTMLQQAYDDFANGIQALTSTGFQVGSDGAVNQSTKTYCYIAIWNG